MGFTMAFTLKLNVMALEDRTCLSSSLGVPLPPPPPPPPPLIVVIKPPIDVGMGTITTSTKTV